MSDEKEVKVEQVEGAEETKKEEKKENVFSSLWKKAKKGIEDANLEANIRSSFNNKTKNYNLYQTASPLNAVPLKAQVFKEDNYVLVFGEVKSNPGDILSDDDDQRHIVKSCEVLDLNIPVEETDKKITEYARKVSKLIYITEVLQEVQVIRVKDKFYIRKKF